MLSRALENTLSVIFIRAREHCHEFITVEHLLLALLDDPDSSKVLKGCGANVNRLRATLDIFIEETTPHYSSAHKRDIQPTLSFQRVLQRAIDQVRALGKTEVNGASVLIAIYGEPESQAVYFMQQEKVMFSDVMNYISQDVFNTTSMTHDDIFSTPTSMPNIELGTAKEQSKEQELITQYTVNLNEKAKRGKIDPLIGRSEELERCVQVLCRRRKNNPMLVGEAGVGKTAIAEGLAQLIIDKNVPSSLKKATVYSLDLAMLLAGTKYRGDFEKRFKAVLKALSAEKNAVIFIDEIHNLVGAGSATGSTMDASNLIKPLLSSGELRCMGATTYEEYRQYIEKDNALLRRFQKVDVEEPNTEEALEILNGVRPRFEKFHGITYTDEALQRAVELSSRYMSDRQLPDKAIDIIDEAGAFQQLLPASERTKRIDVSEIEKIIARITRVPVEKLDEHNKMLLRSLGDRLKDKVYGQDHAIEQLTDAIKLSRAGLRNPDKPVGSFLLAGPTGVGKTEVVKQLAEELGLELIRFDMSECMERHAVSRLIGAPPGYVGHEQAGLLTEAVIKNPHAVLLLDEIEKAHTDVFNILLQMMDYGKLTDNNGRKADFRHVIIIMTSNVGAEVHDKNVLGFSEKSVDHSDAMTAVKTVFTPEFRNRLDAVIPFNALSRDVILRVVEKNLSDLQKLLDNQNVELNVCKRAKTWLAENGYDEKMGARPMARLIEDAIKKPLANEILFGDYQDVHGEVFVDLKGGELRIEAREMS